MRNVRIVFSNTTRIDLPMWLRSEPYSNNHCVAIIQDNVCLRIITVVGTKFYCLHALAGRNYWIQIMGKVQRFSSTVSVL